MTLKIHHALIHDRVPEQCPGKLISILSVPPHVHTFSSPPLASIIVPLTVCPIKTSSTREMTSSLQHYVSQDTHTYAHVITRRPV